MIETLQVAAGALTFAAYVAAPVLLLTRAAPTLGRVPARELAAVALLWLPIELHLLPPLRLAALGGVDVSRFVGLATAMYLFLVVRPLPGVGFTFRLRWRDLALALAAFVAFSAIALPIGFATGFIAWHPQPVGTKTVTTPLVIYLLVALPEEFLFRGLIQNLLGRWLGPTRALAVASVVFGLAHLPDPRYVLLATLAGVAYGSVYRRTERVTASAITHALVDAVWVLSLRA